MDQSPSVGRKEDLEFLQQAWADVENGIPRLVVLVGDRGIGKTRLMHELYAWLAHKQPLVDGQGYWPAALSPGDTRDVNPPEAGFPAPGDVPLPWLWWGMRFLDLRTRISTRELGAMWSRRWVLPKDLASEEPDCDIAMEPLPEGYWVVWEHPDDDLRRRWIDHNEGARRWLGYQVPTATGGKEHAPADDV